MLRKYKVMSLLSDWLQENSVHFFLQIIIACIECVINSHGDEDLLVQWKATKPVHLDDTGHLVSRMHFHTLTLHVVRIANRRFFFPPLSSIHRALQRAFSFFHDLILFHCFFFMTSFYFYSSFRLFFYYCYSFIRKFILVFFILVAKELRKLKRTGKDKILDENYSYTLW